MDKRIVDFTYKSKISEISLHVMALKKQLWENSRKEHNRLKEQFKKINEHRRKHNYWIMQDPEVYVYRALEELDDMKKLINEMVQLSTSIDVIKLLNSELELIDTISLTISIDEHKQSFFA